MPTAESHADPSSDPLRQAKPGSDLEAHRARAKIEEHLFGGAQTVAVGRYRIERRLGAGAMGVVYRAHDPDLARDVAVKLLNPETASGDATETAQGRLVREARAMAKVAHPNVIHVYDVGTVEQGVFIAMELVEGQDLATWLRESAPPWREILAACIAAGRGMAAAHAAGVIHRDFKPENVLVGRDGRVRVVDFGLAAPQPGMEHASQSRGGTPSEVQDEPLGGESPTAESLTRTGTILGTPKYMAPEQYAGFPSERSDQFSFCVTTFEALYGCAPFEGTTLSVYRKNVLEGRIVPAPSGTAIPPAVYEELIRGLSGDPELRHRDLEQLLVALEDAATRVGKPWWTGQTVRGSAAALILGSLVVAGMMWSSTAENEREPAVARATSVDQGTSPAAVASSETREPLPPIIRPRREPPPSDIRAHVEAEAAQEPDSKEPRPTARINASPRTCYYLQDKWKKLGERRRGATSKFLTFSSACYECWQDAPSYMVPNLQDGDHCRHHVACTPVQGSDTARCSD